MYKIEVENIKCNGCVKSITSALKKINGIIDVDIDRNLEIVIVEGSDETKQEAIDKLASIGYPEKGENNLLTKAKSYVSCAIGKMQD